MRIALGALVGLAVASFVAVDVVVERLDRRAAEPAAPSQRVVVLGFDGADPDFLELLLAQGKLPHFARLVREGAFGPCRTFKPTKSVVVWTSVATGKRMEKHGIVDWMLLSGDGKEKVMATGNVRRAEALWNIASRTGKGVQILNWWATWPAEPVRGEMVSNHYPKALGRPLEDVTYPPGLFRELSALPRIDREEVERRMREAGIPVYRPELADDTFRPTDNFRVRFRTSVGLFHEDWLVEQALDYLLDTRGQRDLVGVLFRNIDIFSHFLWRFIDRRLAERVFRALNEEGAPVTAALRRRMKEAYARVLEPVYVHEDRRLGRIMDRLGPDTVLVVVSDHGFQFRNYGFNHYDHGEGGVKAPPGVILLWGPPVRPGVRLAEASVFDVAPTVLHLLGLAAGRDMDGRVLTEALRPEWLAARPVRWIDTYETGRRGGDPRQSPLDEDILRELRTLGYVP